MKYQKTFTTEAQMLATDFANADYPLVYYSQDDHGIAFETVEDYEASEIYTPHTPPAPEIPEKPETGCLRISTPCRITLTHYGTNATTTKPKIYFDGSFTTWNDNPDFVWSLGSQVFDADDTEEVGDVGYIELWGDNQDGFSHSNYDFTIMKIEGENIEVSGNIMSLISNEIPDELPSEYCFCDLFNGGEIVDASDLILPATTLTDYCYKSMFQGCYSLTTAPELPATTLADYCYYQMFSDCASLTSAPELPATTLASNCYAWMFNGCISLTTAPELPATTLADYCYYTMFQGCDSLTSLTIKATNIDAVMVFGGILFGIGTFGTLYVDPSMIDDPAWNDILPDRWTIEAIGGTTPDEPDEPEEPDDSVFVFDIADYAQENGLYDNEDLNHIYTNDYNINMSFSSIKYKEDTDTGLQYINFSGRSPRIDIDGIDGISRIEFIIDESSTATWDVVCEGGTVNEGQWDGLVVVDEFEYRITLKPNNRASGLSNPYKITQIKFYYATEEPEQPDEPDEPEETEIPNKPATGCFRVSAPCSITFENLGTNADTTKPKLYYSITEDIWTPETGPTQYEYPAAEVDYSDSIITSTGYIEIWGDNTDGFSHSESNYTIMKIEGENIEVSGNIMSLISNEMPDELPCDYCFYEIFSGSEIVDASNLILPADELTEGCYAHMFFFNDYLTTGPELPATTLASHCYFYMFGYCGSLTSAPELPATALADYCYANMFDGCMSLESATELPATTLAYACYEFMFSACSSLTTAPELPATTLFDYCYEDMFQSCSSLTSVTIKAIYSLDANMALEDMLHGITTTGTLYVDPTMIDDPAWNAILPENWTLAEIQTA